MDVLVGAWDITLENAWFLESMDTQRHGTANVRWLGDSFIEFDAELEREPTWHFVFGRSDPAAQLFALYHDPRPTSRLFRMTFADNEWHMWREDSDMHQRFAATVTPDRLTGHWDASDDEGATWRKDFDVIFERR
jgi:hypothetical protein